MFVVDEVRVLGSDELGDAPAHHEDSSSGKHGIVYEVWGVGGGGECVSV